MKKWYTILLFFLAACQTKEVSVDLKKSGYSYFPLEEEKYKIYEVEETYYSITANPITRKFQVKEVISQKYTDLSGQEAFHIYRFYRNNSQESWNTEPDSVWSAKLDGYRATRKENNVDFVKLAFPVQENYKWDGNNFNSLGNENYVLSGLDKPYQVAGQTFAHTLQVTHSQVDDNCGKDLRFEIYADNVGLIYKESAVLEYVQSNNICDGKKKINYGFTSIQALIESGK